MKSITNCNYFCSSGIIRRVSFETSVIDDPVPPSPNTRRKNFSFTPISPGPHSPGGRQSKSSSTNASPFVSPRNTPVPRSKTTSHVSSAPVSFVAQQTINSGRKHLKSNLKYKTDTELFNEHEQTEHAKPFIQTLDITSKCNLPMSAPPSPMLPFKQKSIQKSNLLQKLLDSNSKVSYIPDYDKTMQTPLSQEVSQLMSTNQYTNANSYRSQSVPLHQMASNLMSPCLTNSQNQFSFNFENNSVPATPATEFSEFEPFPDTDILNNGLNNENLNQILNILDTTQSNQLEVQDNVQDENIFNFAPANVLSNDLPFNALQNDMIQHSTLNKPIRSQSIDEIANISQQKFQLSRSVPSTPLPFKSKLNKPLELNLNNNQMLGDLYECSKTLNDEQDFLLNGTPVAKKKFTFDSEVINENITFPQSLGFMVNNNLNDGKLCFGNNNARRNLNSILEQQFDDQDEFTTVPNLNNS